MGVTSRITLWGVFHENIGNRRKKEMNREDYFDEKTKENTPTDYDEEGSFSDGDHEYDDDDDGED